MASVNADAAAKQLPSKKTPSSIPSKGQKSILGFFQKKAAGEQTPSKSLGTTTLPIGSPKKKFVQQASSRVIQNLTPAPSSDAIEEEDEDVVPAKPRKRVTGLPSPVTPASFDGAVEPKPVAPVSSSPTRKVHPFPIFKVIANPFHSREKPSITRSQATRMKTMATPTRQLLPFLSLGDGC